MKRTGGIGDVSKTIGLDFANNGLSATKDFSSSICCIIREPFKNVLADFVR